MKISILAVGKLKAGPEQQLFEKYERRSAAAGKALNIKSIQTIEIPEARSNSSATRKSVEASELCSRAPDKSRVVVFDERGKEFSSQQFADFLQNELDNGTQSLCFAIGGPDGHGEELLNEAVLKVRFGSMTWPHQIARILLAEQLYRAITILSNHPYHRE